MEQINTPSIAQEIASYCEKAGIAPTTLTVRVLGNSRFMDRLTRRAEKQAEDEAKLRAYMRDNPPAAKAS